MGKVFPNLVIFIVFAVCGRVTKGRHVHKRQRPIQDEVCRRHVHSDADRAQSERPQENPRKAIAEREEEQTAHQLIIALKFHRTLCHLKTL